MTDSPPVWTSATIATVFVLLATWFLVDPIRPQVAIPAAASVSAEEIDREPPRDAMTDPPHTFLAGYDRECMDCHQIFKAGTPHWPLYQHNDIPLEHGDALKGQCLECHDREDRNRLALYGGETVPFSEVPRLCGKCHGPVYRDWQRGMHGRTEGSWDASSGKQWRLICTQCHDPHHPRYNAYSPLPGPNTIRMGDQSGHEHESKSPLMRWSR